jgi:AmmeMemoRadiSam system protein A
MRLPDRQELPGNELLRLARSSIEHGLEHGEPLPVNCDELHQALTQPAATFTTLRLAGNLRGCCGTLEAAFPLAADVARSAFQAAFRDSRFNPVEETELQKLKLEVSVLSSLEPIPVTDEADLLSQLQPGTDGLVIVEGGRRATFLPKVWESLPEPRRFVAQLKAKCGLPRDYWSERLEFLRYDTMTYVEPICETDQQASTDDTH